jgi:hypothetical protein
VINIARKKYFHAFGVVLAALVAAAAVWLPGSPQAQSPQPGGSIQMAQADDAMWEQVKNSNDASLVEAFMTVYPQSRHIQAARDKLATLKQGAPSGGATPPPRPVPPPVASTPAPAPAPPSAPSTDTVRRVFEQPRVNENRTTDPDRVSARLDQCRYLGRDCGHAAADVFCKWNGFHVATSFKVEPADFTWVPGDFELCVKNNCKALAAVTCEGTFPSIPQETEKLFPQPRINETNFSECAAPNRDCGGEEMAHTFCRAVGYMGGAKSFKLSPSGTRSIYPADQKVCTGPECRAITDVMCIR